MHWLYGSASKTGGGFKYFFMFTPKPREMIQFDSDAYFSDGLSFSTTNQKTFKFTVLNHHLLKCWIQKLKVHQVITTKEVDWLLVDLCPQNVPWQVGFHRWNKRRARPLGQVWNVRPQDGTTSTDSFGEFLSNLQQGSKQEELGGGNSNIFYLHPENLGNDPIWRAYFSNGLKPKTSLGFSSISQVISNYMGMAESMVWQGSQWSKFMDVRNHTNGIFSRWKQNSEIGNWSHGNFFWVSPLKYNI